MIESAIVFIHRSIKTRIETGQGVLPERTRLRFLYIDPLKQGLKLGIFILLVTPIGVFIHRSIKTRIETVFGLREAK